MRNRRSIFGPGALAGLLAVSGGCVSPENDTLLIGRSTTLEALTPAAGIDLEGGHGNDRSRWGTTIIEAPVHGTIHRPTYAPNHFLNRSLARHRNLYPTWETATDRCAEGADRQAEEAVKAHLAAVVDLLLVVPRMVVLVPPDKPVRSPDEWHGRDWLSHRDEAEDPGDGAR